MKTTIAVLNFIGNLFKFLKKDDHNVLKESTRDFYQLTISDESRKMLTLANEWRELIKFYPRLKVNLRLEPKDLGRVQEKYEIPFSSVVRISNLGLIKKMKMGR